MNQGIEVCRPASIRTLMEPSSCGSVHVGVREHLGCCQLESGFLEPAKIPQSPVDRAIDLDGKSETQYSFQVPSFLLHFPTHAVASFDWVLSRGSYTSPLILR